MLLPVQLNRERGWVIVGYSMGKNGKSKKMKKLSQQANDKLKWLIEKSKQSDLLLQTLPKDEAVKKLEKYQLRCPGCNKLISEFGIETIGLTHFICHDSRCGANFVTLHWMGKPYIFDHKMMKKKHMMAEIKELHSDLYQGVVEIYSILTKQSK